ncbi:hypothetical protein [Mycobacterium sp. E2479]|uniref:hypothetical protein n=1 Tax=Mycobacterium sp. E2479 TaxID=1834134 RepID=UPI0012EA5CA9|nr:hypothetical protein [Mycobacterium sp. E2479]
MAEDADTWRRAIAQREQLLNVLAFECIVSGLLRATAEDLSFAAIRSSLRARLLQRQLGGVPKQTHKSSRADGSMPGMGDRAEAPPKDHPVESLPVPAAGDSDAVQSVDNLENRLKARQSKTVRALLFAADAHNRAAKVHEQAARLGIGDAAAHRQAADRHRAAQAEAIRRRWVYLTAATQDLISDGSAQASPTDDAA